MSLGTGGGEGWRKVTGIALWDSFGEGPIVRNFPFFCIIYCICLFFIWIIIITISFLSVYLLLLLLWSLCRWFLRNYSKWYRHLLCVLLLSLTSPSTAHHHLIPFLHRHIHHSFIIHFLPPSSFEAPFLIGFPFSTSNLTLVFKLFVTQLAPPSTALRKLGSPAAPTRHLALSGQHLFYLATAQIFLFAKLIIIWTSTLLWYAQISSLSQHEYPRYYITVTVIVT